MTKIACFFTGDNYDLVVADTPSSRKKIVALAIAMLVPVLIWIFNGFMLSYQVLKAGLGWSVLTAIVCGSIVFFIEKLIIMASGNRWLTFFRICIGFIVALLGSIAIDEVIFKDDIDIAVAAIKETEIGKAKMEEERRFARLNDYAGLEKNIADAQGKYDNAVDAALAEADGSKGTRYRGIGAVARFKDKKANERKVDLNLLLSQKAQLNRAKDTRVTEAGTKVESSYNEHALLTRIKALFHLVVKDGYMLCFYIFFTLLLFFFEFLVVILKLTWKKTNYERKLEMIEEIGAKRMEFLQKKDSPMIDPGYYLPQLKQARIAVKKNQSIFN